MKITTDVNSAGLRSAGNVQPRPPKAENRTVQSDAGFTSDIIIKMQKERSMIDALALAQTSRELVQKAINVSSRLMSLASEAMRTGRMDINELNTQISGIQGTMLNYGESVSVPAGNTMPADELQVKMQQSFAKLKEAASEIIPGKSSAGNNLESVTAGLNQLASEFDSRIKNLYADFGGVKQIDSTFDYGALNKSTADFLIKSPEKALLSQGNVHAEMAGKLTLT